jgi:flagellar biosynthesis/type III secretory pathway ATPase
VEGDDQNEPIADAARSILDGHIVLNRKLTSRGHYPPIDVLNSLSRTMPMTVEKSQIELARTTRELMAAYEDVSDLVQIGAYKSGSNPLSDAAIARKPFIDEFLKQDKDTFSRWDQTLAKMSTIPGKK